MFIMYQEKYPKVVLKIQMKFEKFNLNYSQLVRFIQIEEKFVKLKQQQH